MVADARLMDHFESATQLFVARFSDGGIFCHWHDLVHIANDMQYWDTSLGNGSQIIQWIALIGHRLTLGHFILLKAVFPVVRTADTTALTTGPALEIHHRRIGIDCRHFLRIGRRPIINNQPAPRHAFQHCTVGEKVLKA